MRGHHPGHAGRELSLGLGPEQALSQGGAGEAGAWRGARRAEPRAATPCPSRRDPDPHSLPPHQVRTYVRAHDVHHGLTLERAGATAVVPETLEPSLQLASAVLAELNMPPEEVAAAVSAFRRNHLAELQALASAPEGGGEGQRFSLGSGYATVDDEDEAAGAGGGVARAGGDAGGFGDAVPA